MALTKISGSILKDPLNLGEVSIGGTLTYQDVTNVDALGVGTFRTGINVSGGQIDVGSNIKLGNAGVITATSFVGGLPITSDGNNRVITATGSGGLNGESTLTYGGNGVLNLMGASGNTQLALFRTNANTTGTTGTIGFYASDNDVVAGLYALGDGDNEGAHLVFKTTTAASGTNPYSDLEERLRISSGGMVNIGTNNQASGHSSSKLRVGTASGSDQGIVVFGNADTTTPALVITNWDGSQTQNKSVIHFDNSGWGTFQIGGTAGADAFAIWDDNVERLRITSGGKTQFSSATDNIIHTSSNSSRLRLFGGSNESVSNGAVLTLHGVSHSAGNYADLAAATGGHIQFRIGTTEKNRIDSSGISGTIKNNYTLVAFVSDRDDGSRSSGSNSYQDDTGLNLSSAITYKHGDIIFAEALCPGGIALTSTDTSNYQGVHIRIKITPSSGTTRYSNDTIAWYRNDGRATKETMQLTATHYHIQAGDSSTFNDNVSLSFQVQYKRGTGGAGGYGATGLSNWAGERTLKVWQFRKEL